jgi:hypothetical protein
LGPLMIAPSPPLVAMMTCLGFPIIKAQIPQPPMITNSKGCHNTSKSPPPAAKLSSTAAKTSTILIISKIFSPFYAFTQNTREPLS